MGFIAAAILIAACLSAYAETGTARFKATQDIAWPIEFSAEYFQGDGRDYRQDLARSSLGMALSAMRKADVGLPEKGDNIAAYLMELGFSEPRLDQYDVEPSIETIASAIASMPVGQDGEGFTLVAVAVSGGGYKDEWKSNFLIGKGTQHEGFNRAAEEVVSRLKEYIQDRAIAGRVKVWISGYSRAAATANRASAILLDGALVPAEDLFAYTFATPNVTRQEDAASYPSIFNIVGPFDPVPMIPLEEWGYSRFGSTHYLPSSETNSDYMERVRPVGDAYYEMTGGSYWENESGNLLLQKVYGYLGSVVPTVDDYVDHYQAVILEAWDDKGNPLKLISGVLDALLGDGDLLKQLEEGADDAWSVASNAVAGLILQSAGLSKDEWNGGAGVGENLVHEHLPKGYLAWLSAYGDLESMVSRNQRYRQVYAGGCSAIRITGGDGRPVTDYALDGDAAKVGEEDLFPVVLNGDEMVVTVPADRAYRIELTAAPAEECHLTIREEKTGVLKARSYEVSLSSAEGTVYICRLPEADASGGDGYQVTWSGGSAPLVLAEGSFLDKLEATSSARTILSQDLRTVALVLALLILQILFYIGMALRAVVLCRRRAREKKSLPPVRYHRLRFAKNQPVRALIKILSACILAAAILLLTECVSSGDAWFKYLKDVDKPALFWFLLMVSAPPVLMMLFSALPALLAALYAFIWPEEDAYDLRTARRFQLFALLCTAALAAYGATDPNASVHMAHLAYPIALLVFLAAAWVLSLVALRAENKAKAPEAAPPA